MEVSPHYNLSRAVKIYDWRWYMMSKVPANKTTASQSFRSFFWLSKCCTCNLRVLVDKCHLHKFAPFFYPEQTFRLHRDSLQNSVHAAKSKSSWFIYSTATLMLDYIKIKIKFTKPNIGRQKLTDIYTIMLRFVFKWPVTLYKFSSIVWYVATRAPFYLE